LPLVCSLLRERPQRDILREISDYQPAQESALRSADDFLAEGRYLDALNQYQMFYFKNPMHTGALERIVAAQLHIGNRQKAREALERLLILDPENEEARRRLEEVQQGRWSEEGDLFQAAQQRNKQVLGKGVELRDTIAPEVLREFQKEE
jgi:tetratricopeptide (TPR) repeat protein